MHKHLRWILPLAALGWVGCFDEVATGGAGAGNPPFAEVTVSIQAHSADPASQAKAAAQLQTNPDGSLTLIDAQGAALTLTSIQAWVLDYEFELPQNLICSDSLSNSDCVQERILSNGSLVTDFIAKPPPSAPPEILQVPIGTYGSVGIDLVNVGRFPGQDSVAYPAFQNLLIFGHLGAADSSGARFVFRMAVSDSIDFQTPDSVIIKFGILNQVILPVDVDGWFRNVDLKSCVQSAGEPVDSDGTVELRGDTACAGAGLKVRMNVQASGVVDTDD